MQRPLNITAITAAMFLATGAGFAETPIPPGAKVLTVGEISKLDTKSRSITLNDATTYDLAQLSKAGDTTVAGRGGGQSGGVPQGGGGRHGGGGGRGGGGSVPSGRGASAPIPHEYKIVVSPKTVIKDGDSDIKLEDLHMFARSLEARSPRDRDLAAHTGLRWLHAATSSYFGPRSSPVRAAQPW